MDNVFYEEIADWNSWGKVFQSIPAFEKLIKRIFIREGLLCKEISHLTADLLSSMMRKKYARALSRRSNVSRAGTEYLSRFFLF